MKKERGILFSSPMVRAILEGRKMQTRRPVKPQPESADWVGIGGKVYTQSKSIGRYAGARVEKKCPFGKIGDQLWVRETWANAEFGDTESNYSKKRLIYKADFPTAKGPWKPSIHMPRWASRITLEITKVGVERIQDVSACDCLAEGKKMPGLGLSADVDLIRKNFSHSWQDIYPGSWDRNDWVWVVEFKRVPS